MRKASTLGSLKRSKLAVAQDYKDYLKSKHDNYK